MDVKASNINEAIVNSTLAFEHPAKLLGIDIETLREKPPNEQIQLATDLEYLSRQMQLASTWIVVGACIRNRIDTKEIKRIAAHEYIINPGGYFPSGSFSSRCGVLFKAIEFGFVDRKMFATEQHYSAINEFFYRNLYTANLYRKFGITAASIMRSIVAHRWVPVHTRRILKKLIEVLDAQEPQADNIRLLELIKQYIPNIENRLSEAQNEN